MSLDGKRIVVTGASSGIGLAIAGLLVERGAEVFGLCRRIGKLPEGVVPVSCDLLQGERIGHAFEIIDEAVDGVDGLVNNAGLAYLERVMDGSRERFEEMWRVNVQGLLICTQEALRRFPDSGGRVVNLSSMSGHRVPPTGGFYSPTKFAVRALTESLRLELAAEGLRHQVATVSPGFVDTPLLDHYFEGREEQLAAMRAETPMLKPSDVAEAVVGILEAPGHVNVGDVQLRPAGQKV
ncbi:MAG: SDR family NAD(P)-dependent oxidoreductase [Verrucomicrobiota bacterium]